MNRNQPYSVPILLFSQILVIIAMFFWTENKGIIANLILIILLIVVGIILWAVIGGSIGSLKELWGKVLWKISGGTVRDRYWLADVKFPILFVVIGVFFIIWGLGEAVFIMFIFANLFIYAYLK